MVEYAVRMRPTKRADDSILMGTKGVAALFVQGGHGGRVRRPCHHHYILPLIVLTASGRGEPWLNPAQRKGNPALTRVRRCDHMENESWLIRCNGHHRSETVDERSARLAEHWKEDRARFLTLNA